MHRQGDHPGTVNHYFRTRAGCGKFLEKFKLVLDKFRFFLYNQPCSEEHGPVVQSVSTPACHAGGRRFESVRGRQKRKPSKRMAFLFCLPTDSKNEMQQSGGLSQPPWPARRRASPFGVASKHRVPSGSPSPQTERPPSSRWRPFLIECL